MANTKKKYYSWQNIENMTLNLCDQVKDLNIDYIIALARGGCVPGVTMSHNLDIPMIPIKLSTSCLLNTSPSPRDATLYRIKYSA